ncbi:MAG TPA: alpha-galactosidase [Lacipirellulaceae bacterium]|nr:alpha-galactosidase [Lacipirellulaceae bacterium]
MILLSASRASIATAVEPTKEEIAAKSMWVDRNWRAGHETPPFSFDFQTAARSTFPQSWKRDEIERSVDQNRTELIITWTHEASGLEVRAEAIEYRDFPAIEWTVYFKNNGGKRTPLLQDITGLDLTLTRGDGGEFVLHGIKGDFCSADSYEPFQLEMPAGFEKKFSPPPYSGKSSDGPDGWPYHNLQMPGGGMIVAVGWPGQWESSFTRVGGKGLRMTAGQQLTHLVLEPGEEIRTPLIAILFWQGEDVVRSQNLWRQWYLKHVIPHVDGKPQGPLKQIQVDGSDTNFVQRVLDAGIRPDLCWRDAGGANTWYPSDKGPYASKPGEPDNRWLNTGTWDIDRTKYPLGFRPFSDWVRANGMQFLLWFEPERVGSRETWLGQNHVDWLLPATDMTVGDILNLGNREALTWLIEHIDGMIKSEGIDWYREDMNGNGPLSAWRAADSEDRQGITENLYIQGHLKFWDELLRRNPGLSIDSCASGGRRNDLETMRRAVPLLRSDLQFPDSQRDVIEGNQCHTYGLSSWLPFQGTGVYRYDPYSLRSFYLPSFGMGSLSDEHLTAQAKAFDECEQIAESMLFGDYYPLTPYTLALDAWIAWQFDRPDVGEGAVQAFRRQRSPQSSIRLKLRGLRSDAIYEVTDFDKGTSEHTGAALMEDGLEVSLEPRGSAVFRYRGKISNDR